MRIKLKVDRKFEEGRCVKLRESRQQLISLSKRLTDIMKRFATGQADYKERCKAQLKRQLEVAECPRTDDELEEMLESENPQIFTQGILMDTQQARQNAADIEARHEDILKLERSIRELHELFLDLAAMVESQSELIDRIEYNVSATKDHVEGAKQSTRRAVEYKTKTRKLGWNVDAFAFVSI
ncbi:syntaxin 1A [Paragonimus westermani]|uniref:Syntaxin 1A n=1 Tax=Paragonimus westermani TaxID=34504 RepID=A0A5J4NUE4_9TREM|nr:syntaxin 1A [Paragonimus westermani]